MIFEINDYFLKTLQEQYPNDTDLLGRASSLMNPTVVVCVWPGWRLW
ncbi:hypothetical protein ACLK1T_14510 [Escherichia coli]